MEKIKVGEGSRGGKIIGHTKSGKPIYQSPFISRNYSATGYGKVINNERTQQASKSKGDSKMKISGMVKQLEEIEKAKYTSRTGTPGHYKYTYDNKDNTPAKTNEPKKETPNNEPKFNVHVKRDGKLSQWNKNPMSEKEAKEMIEQIKNAKIPSVDADSAEMMPHNEKEANKKPKADEGKTFDDHMKEADKKPSIHELSKIPIGSINDKNRRSIHVDKIAKEHNLGPQQTKKLHEHIAGYSLNSPQVERSKAEITKIESKYKNKEMGPNIKSQYNEHKMTLKNIEPKLKHHEDEFNKLLSKKTKGEQTKKSFDEMVVNYLTKAK